MQFLCCEQRKTVFKVEAHLMSEYTVCTGSCPIFFLDSFTEDTIE